MRTTDKNKSIFQGKPIYRNRTFYSNYGRITKENINQNFVVPWQMSKAEEREIMVK